MDSENDIFRKFRDSDNNSGLNVDKKDLLTEQEIHEFGIDIIYKYAQNEGYEILDGSTDIDKHPQIVMKKDDQLYFVMVKTTAGNGSYSEYDKKIALQVKEIANKHNAKILYAGVGLYCVGYGFTLVRNKGFSVDFKGFQNVFLNNTTLFDEIKNLAISLGAQKCKNCGNIDYAFGLINPNNSFSECIVCSAKVPQYDKINTTIFVSKAIQTLIHFDDVKNNVLNNSILTYSNDFLKNLIEFKKMPNDIDIIQFQKLIKSLDNINIGSSSIGGFINFEKGLAKVKIIKSAENNQNNIYVLFILTIVFNHIINFELNDYIDTINQSSDIQMISAYFNKLLKKNYNIFGKPKSDVRNRVASWMRGNPNSIITYKILKNQKIKTSELPSELDMQTLVDIYTLHNNLLDKPFE